MSLAERCEEVARACVEEARRLRALGLCRLAKVREQDAEELTQYAELDAYARQSGSVAVHCAAEE